MSIPSELKYTASHEWVRLDGNVATIGITHHAQDALGELVHVEPLEDPGEDIKAGAAVVEVESSKSTSEVYSPFTGRLLTINPALENDDEAASVNSDPYGSGWLFRVRLSDPSELDALLDAKAYGATLE